MAEPKRIGILVVAYNAASTLARVLDRIPAEFVPRITRVLVSDDASQDETYLVGLGYKQIHGRRLPIEVLRNRENVGYGGNQKICYEYAIEHDLDIVVLLHADGQYAPELLPDIVAPLERGEADAVFGSRMMTRGGARQGGMPVTRRLGNKVLTAIETGFSGRLRVGWTPQVPDALRNAVFTHLLRQQPRVAVVAAGGGVDDAAVVPHQQHAGLPAVAVDEVVAHLVAEQLHQQRLRFGIVHAFDADGVARADVERAAAGLRMHAPDRVRLRGQCAVVVADGHRAALVALAVHAVARIATARRMHALQAL